MSRLLSIVLAAGLIAIACQSERTAEISPNIPIAFSDNDGTEPYDVYDSVRNSRPYLVMASGELTINNRCPVREVKLNKRLPALYVNGRPVGFC